MLLGKIYHMGVDMLERYFMHLASRNEIKKFKDPRRKAIYETINLSKEQKEAIDRVYVKNLGRKIPYTWHKHYTAFTGHFDEKYFPELLYIPEFERFMNLDSAYTRTFSDKNVLPYLASANGVRTPKTFLSRTAGLLRDSSGKVVSLDEAISLLQDIGVAFCKPTIDTSSGQGCFVIDMHAGVDKNSGKSTLSIIDDLGDDFVVQEKIICHKQVSDLHPGSCNTFRIISYRWKDEFNTTPTVMRIGMHGNHVDNAHAGGIFVAMDDNGTLHERAFDEFNQQFTKHLDSGIVFNGYKIDGFPLCRGAAIKLHKAIPQIGVINWDFTLDEANNPVLIEANMDGGGIWLVEMAHGIGPFGDNTEEILRWIALMEKTPASKRKQYAFGMMK